VDRSEKLRIETIAAAIFASRLGLAPSQLSFPRKETDGDGPDALVAVGGRTLILELTMADPESSGTLPESQKGTDILTGGLRAAYRHLSTRFEDQDVLDRPFDVEIRFNVMGPERRIELPKAREVPTFLAELRTLSNVLTSDRSRFRHSLHKSRPSMEVNAFRDYQCLQRYCRNIRFTDAYPGHPGRLSSFQMHTLWPIDADIAGIVRRKSAKTTLAHWLVIFEWGAPGAIPNTDDLPALQSSKFERIFVLEPAIPGRFLEWMEARWEPIRYTWDFERRDVNLALRDRGLPTL